MSGPKVVRIVTREEMIARSEAFLSQLESAVSHWDRQSTKVGELSDHERAATRNRAAQIRALLQNDRFTDIERAVPTEILFLRQDLAERERRAIEKKAERKRYDRRIRENSSSLLGALKSRHIDLPDDLIRSIESLANGAFLDAAEDVLARGFALLATSTENDSATTEQRELAKKLNEELSPTTVREWLGNQIKLSPRDEREEREERIYRYISELELLEGPDLTTSFVERLRAASGEIRLQQRNLLLDSIVLDLAAMTRACQQRRELLDEIRDVGTALVAISGDASASLLAEANAIGTSRDIALHQDLLNRARAFVLEQTQQEAALARRKAVLDGLATLGYEVREGMATAWAESGRVVLRKSMTPGYGVELAGRADNGRLQVRAVALSQGHDKQRDRDIETIWCGEFKELQSRLSAAGNSLSIEQARGVGEVPLKVVALDEGTRQGDSKESIPRQG